MTTQPSYAGEFFDLSITSINNDYGALHNIGVMLYGINFPLEKFIKELEMIISESPDDKTTKREARLAFLQYCDTNIYLKVFFQSFCNYLNGKDGSGEQYPNFIVITAAGGNIIIVFAQLIMNIINAYKAEAEADKLNVNPDLLLPTNKILLNILKSNFPDVNRNTIITSIVAHFTTDTDMLEKLSQIESSEASDCDFKLSPNIFQTRDQESEFAVDQATSIITGLDLGPSQEGGAVDDYIQQLHDKIIQFGESESESEKKASFKLILRILSQIIHNEDKSKAGFLLFRAKTLIDCRQNYKSPYTPKALKAFKETCSSKYKNLYPQIIQQKHLDEAVAELINQYPDENFNPKTHPCFIYLNHLMEKKKAIKNSTQSTINQIIQLFVEGYFKQANPAGHMAPVIVPSIYKTEALIAYIRNITGNINMYIHEWFRVRMSKDAAPAKSLLAHHNYDYKSLVKLFLSLDTMITNNSLIPFLCADILNYFINGGSFHTETILDELIKSFNADRAAKRESDCVMLHSDILLVPSSYQIDLSKIKNVFNNIINLGLGYPDGLRITINAIITEKIKDIQAITKMLLLAEHEQQAKGYVEEQYEVRRDRDRDTGSEESEESEESDDDTPDERKKRADARKREDARKKMEMAAKRAAEGVTRYDGGKKYYKKNITFKKKIVKKTNEKLKTKSKKTRRQKNLRKVTLKHKKPRKHKSIKHKYRKHKL